MEVVFIVCRPFEKRDFIRFGLQILIDNNYEVSVWDCTLLLNIEYFKFRPVSDYRFDREKIFNKVSDLIDALNKKSHKTILVILFGLDWRTKELYTIISQSKFHYGLFNQTAIPGISVKNRMLIWPLQVITSGFDKFVMRKPLNYLIQSIPLRFYGLREYDFVVAAGSNSVPNMRLIGGATKIIWSHSFDYDVAINEKDNSKLKHDEYITYLDQYLPFHPDAVYCDVPYPVTAESFYPKLVRFFNNIENKMGIKVVIAAHPRSQYDLHKDCFEGREIIKNKTAALIKYTKCVIGHYSTGLNFANIYNKPTIFLKFNTSAVEGIVIYIDTMASWFGKKAINLDEMYDIDTILDQELIVDENAYRRYREANIKRPRTPEKLGVEIFIDYLKELEDKL